jgi:two-component system sensor histidine kinase/response regulator
MQEFFVWFTGASLICAVVLGAHALRSSYSLAPIYVCLGFVSSTMMWLVTVDARIEFYNLTVLWGSTFFASLLVGVFVLYVFDGTQAARLAILTTIGVIVATYLLETSLSWQAAAGMSQMRISWPAPSSRLYLGSALVVVIDMVIMAMLWEALIRWRGAGSLVPSIFVTLLGTLALDSLLFPLAALGNVPRVEALMQGSLAERLILLLWLSPLLAWYVRWQQRMYGSDLGRGKVLSILVGSAISEKRLSRAEAEIRERMRVEEQLRQNEEQFRTLVENIPGVIFRCLRDEQQTMVYVSESVMEVTGCASSEFFGENARSLTSFIHPDDRATVAQHVNEAAESRKPYNCVYRLVRPDGAVRWLEERGQVNDDGQGQEWLDGVITDITERLAIENELRRNETALQTVLDNCRAVVFLKDVRGRYLLVNSFFEEALGMDKNQAIGKTDFELRERHIAERMANIDQRVIEVGEGAQYEEEVPTPAGEIRTYVTNKVPLFDENGGVYGLCGFATDITDRKLQEKITAENQRRLQLAVDAAAAGTFVWSCQTGLMEWDERSLEIFGLTQESFKETFLDWMRLVHPDDQERVTEGLQENLSETSRWEQEYRVIRPDGEVRTVAAAGYFTLGRDGDPETLIGLHLDVTEQRLAQQALHEAKYAAEQANRAKSDFLATMSHEIRTPMNAVIGMTHLVQRTELTPKQADYVKKIESSAKSLLGIINDILDFSKIEAGKLKFESVDFDLDTVLENLAHLMAVRKAEKENLEILFKVDHEVPRQLKGDPLRLGQVLTNLGANAIKFTEAGQVLVSVRCLEQDPSTGVVLEFSVADSGIGMTMEEQARLFKPFSQTDSSTTRKYGGTGLGLSISKRMVELMDGQIGVESEPGKGSRFYFTVRLGLGNQAPQAPRHMSADLRNLEVLVADDNATSREILDELLSGFGYKVTLSATGQEALDEIKARGDDNPFDLVLLDWRMPGLDGIEAAREIKQVRGEKAPVTILVTAYGRDDVLRGAQQAGVTHVLSKPVNESQLFDAIATAFGSQPNTEPVVAGIQTTLFQGQQVLLVEDNEVNQQVASELLEQADLVVTIANHGQEGVDLLKQRRFDIVLMDVQMPVMDGLTATRLIRKEKLAPKTPIVAMTANAMQGDRDLCLDAGMDDYVAKPIEPEELMATLSRYLQPAGAQPGPVLHAVGGDWEFPIIHGLDPKAGLRRVGNNATLYRKLLLQFRREQGASAAHIRVALAEGDLETATRAAHNLKGVAANLGALQASAQAAELEKRLRGQALQDLEGPLGLLDRTLERLCQELAVLEVEATPVKKEAAPVDLAALTAEVDAIRPLLESDLEQAMVLAEGLVTRYSGSEFQEPLHKLQDALQSFDTDAAQEHLDAIKERVNTHG